MRFNVDLNALLYYVVQHAARAADVAITSDGKSQYVVVTRAKPSAAEALAAAELATYVERMSGAKLAVQTGGALPSKALVVCEEETLHEIAADVKSDAED